MKKNYFSLLSLILICVCLFLATSKRIKVNALPQSKAANLDKILKTPSHQNHDKSPLSKNIQTTPRERSKSNKGNNRNDPDLERLYCKIKQMDPNITLDGDVKIFAGGYNPEDPGEYAWIHSSECPKDKYSIVKINSSDALEMNLDCHDATMEDLVAESGLQWSITYNGPKKNEYKFALNGKGQFLVYCPLEKSFFLTRDVHFLPDDSGFLRNSAGLYFAKSRNPISSST